MVAGVLAACALLAGMAGSAQAATNTLFAAPAAAGTGDCSSAANACTIATAVTDANGTPTTDSVVIELASGDYLLGAPSPTALPITFAGPSLTIEAAGGTPTISGTSTVRILSIAAAANVTLDGLTFTAGSSAGLGGAILNDGTLTIRNSTFSGNSAQNGGAISNSSGATMTVQDSTFSQNSATSVGGGAIINAGTATVVRSALLGNSGPVNGGAINQQPGGSMSVSNSTLAGNTSNGLGGAMSNLGTVTVQSSTIANNSASAGSVIATGTPAVTFAGNILAAQTSGAACSPADTAFTDAGHNLDTDGTCISATLPAVGSHNGTTAYGTTTYGDALNAYLADTPANNGGPTKTLALLNTASPAMTVANPAFNTIPATFDLPFAVGGKTAACALADQRGVTALAGHPCAVGAYLLQATTTVIHRSATRFQQNTPVTYTATVSPVPDGGTVAFDDGAGNPATTACAARPVVSGTATCTVSYPKVGSYQVKATYSGDGTMNNFVGSKSTAQPVTVTATPVVLSNLTVTPCMGTVKGAHRSVVVGYTINVPASVTFTLQRRVRPPAAARRTCPSAVPAGIPGDYVDVTGTSARAAGRLVARAAAATGVLAKTISVGPGAHRFRLSQLLGSNTLSPGRYRVLMQAVSTSGAKGQNAVYFWVVVPKSTKR